MGAVKRHPLFSIIAALMVTLVVLVIIGFTVLRGGSGSAPAGPGQAGKPVQHRPDCTVRWVPGGYGAPTPASPCYGPAHRHDGLASEFSHNRRGAVYAAINMVARLNSASPEPVYTKTLQNQTIGDYQDALSRIQSEESNTAPRQSVPTEWFYRVDSGNARSGLVNMSIAAATREAQTAGGYAATSVTLRWSGGDWKLILPPPTAHLINSTKGFTSLGRVH